MFASFGHALTILFTPLTLLVMFIGCMIGLGVGILPGLGGAATLALLLPFVWKQTPEVAMPLLVALQATVFIGGGITAILLNIPGESTSSATLIDGFPMNQKGEGGRALGASIFSSMTGGIAAVPMSLLMIPVITPIVMNFKSPEVLLLIVMGISFVAILSRSVRKGLISGGLGIALSLIGMHELTGIPRFTFGTTYLYNGLSIPMVVMGWFGLSEMIDLVMTGQTSISKVKVASLKYRDVFLGIKDVIYHRWMWLRVTVIGYIVGVIPGIGPGTAIWLAYGHAKQTSKHPEKFGTGYVEGVIAPEASSGASTAGDLLTTMVFGVPGSLGTGVLLGGFLLVGLTPGPSMVVKNLDLVFTLLLGVALANLFVGLICLIAARQLARLSFIDMDFIYPIILTIIFVAAFVTAGTMLDVIAVIIMAFFGLALDRFGYSRPCLALGFIMGHLFEYYFYRSVLTVGPFFFLSPICLVMIAIMVGLYTRSYWGRLLSRFSGKGDRI